MEAWERVGLYLLAAYGVLTLALTFVDWLGRLSSGGAWKAPFSVVLLARNNEAVIEQVVRVAVGLSWFRGQGLDVVVVDDHSTDGTGSILERLGRRYGYLKFVRMSDSPAGTPALELGMFLTSNPVAIVCDLRTQRDAGRAVYALFLLLRHRRPPPGTSIHTT